MINNIATKTEDQSVFFFYNFEFIAINLFGGKIYTFCILFHWW